uniref:Transmembrane protein n=1 Tax=Cacopsylla melanoneura TaxID=428564 RepID=A0A8D8SAF4_9HEMI
MTFSKLSVMFQHTKLICKLFFLCDYFLVFHFVCFNANFVINLLFLFKLLQFQHCILLLELFIYVERFRLTLFYFFVLCFILIKNVILAKISVTNNRNFFVNFHKFEEKLFRILQHGIKLDHLSCIPCVVFQEFHSSQ